MRVRFGAVPAGTRVVLVHDGWEARADADAARDRYDAGWRPVLAALAHRVREGAPDHADV